MNAWKRMEDAAIFALKALKKDIAALVLQECTSTRT